MYLEPVEQVADGCEVRDDTAREVRGLDPLFKSAQVHADLHGA
jgi:hypothetical protein